MAFVAGQKVRAQELNDLLLGVVMTTDVTVNNNTTFTNATGLSIPLAANAKYGLDGWLHWTSNPGTSDPALTPGPDIKFRYTYPSGATGWWAGIGPHVDKAPVPGSERINYVDFGSVPLTSPLAFAGDDEFVSGVYISAIPRGYIVTSSTSGNLQLQFAQNVARGSNTILRAGSWLRVTRLD